MTMRLQDTLTIILSAALFLSSACGDDHRTEAFCDKICECQLIDDDGISAEECVPVCVVQLDEVELSSSGPAISDECLACVNHASCELVEITCTPVCQIADDQTPEPTTGEPNVTN